MLEVMRKLWTGEMVEHHGRFYDFPRVQMSPAVRKPIPASSAGAARSRSAAPRGSAMAGSPTSSHATSSRAASRTSGASAPIPRARVSRSR
jgi:alkanesulfonate monooxygenase SsuD/methylene tetrahydromethanopterin reductase-like flavin-dependent oxidoreductase (luciferase family)